MTVRWVQLPNQTCSSGESSSSDSEINHNMSSAHQNRLLEPIDHNAESALPSVVNKSQIFLSNKKQETKCFL